MMAFKTTLLLAALLGLLDVLSAGSSHDHRGVLVPGAPADVSQNDRSLQRVVLNAAQQYNNRSNDAFLFRASDIHTAQRQVVKGLLYIVDLEISRTVCRKREHNKELLDCDFQPPGPLHQTLQCHLEVWVVPWENLTKTQAFNCRS